MKPSYYAARSSEKRLRAVLCAVVAISALAGAVICAAELMPRAAIACAMGAVLAAFIGIAEATHAARYADRAVTEAYLQRRENARRHP